MYVLTCRVVVIDKTTTMSHYLSHEWMRGRMLHKLKLNSKTCDLSECI